jgi:Na+-translocating ferredoxin:NAD+ oxidoreductase RnfG subunit
MNPWQKETPGLEVGDTIIWQDEAIEMEGQPVEPGMKGEVISLHDGFHLDVIPGGSVPPKAIVQFENGMRLMVDERMKWQRVADAS